MGERSCFHVQMLQVGNVGVSDIEGRSHFAIWCIMGAPLLIGTDVIHASNATLATLTATELIEVNQDHGLNGAVQGVMLDLPAPPDALLQMERDPEAATVSVVKECSGSNVQWEWLDGVDGAVQITHKASGLLLTDPQCARASWPAPGRGPELTLAPPDAFSCGGKNQLFTLQPNRTITSSVDGSCLNVVGGGGGGGVNTAVQLFAFCDHEHTFGRDVWVVDKESGTIKSSYGCLSNESAPAPGPGPNHKGGGTMQTWAKNMSDGTVAVALINLQDAAPSDLTLSFSSVGLSGSVHVRDGWLRRDIGSFTGQYIAKAVPPHGSAFLRLTPAKLRLKTTDGPSSLELKTDDLAAYQSTTAMILAGCAALSCFPTAASAHTLFVAPPSASATTNSVQQVDGSAARPFTSLHTALEIGVRGLKDANGLLSDNVDILLLPGVHSLSEPLDFGPLDGGDGTHTITLSPSDSAAGATISGGVELGPWTKASPATLKRTGLSGSGDVDLWTAPLPFDLNTDGSSLQLWRGTTRLKLAASPTLKYRHANSTFITFNHSTFDIRSDYHDFNRVLLLLYESWTASLHRMTKVDAANNVAFLATSYDTQWANLPGATTPSGSRFQVQNALELLDEVDEFYFDRVTGRVYIATNSSNTSSSSAPPTGILAAGPTELIRANGTEAAPVLGVRFANLTIGYAGVETASCFTSDPKFVNGPCHRQSANFLTTAVVHLRHASGWAFDECNIGHSGGYAVWFEQGATDCRVESCHIADVGAGGVRVGVTQAVDHEAWSTVATKGIMVSGNVIEDGGHFYQEGCGVLAQNMEDTVIAHNEIRHFRYTGVSMGWMYGYQPTNTRNISTRFNHIHHIGEGWLSDLSCVYTLGHQPESEVRNNVCHDVQSFNYGGWAYYTDEGSRDLLFRDNVATRTKCAGHHQHYGADNIITNNIYYDVNIGDVPTPGRLDVTLTDCDGAIRASTPKGKSSSFAFTHNIVLQPASYKGKMITTIFPSFGLTNFTFFDNNYYNLGDTTATGGYNSSTGDQGGATGGESFSSWQLAGKDARSVVADPKFANLSTFALNVGAPAVKLGFKSIVISNVGPVGLAGVPGAGVGAFSAVRSGSVSDVSAALGVAEEELHAHGLISVPSGARSVVVPKVKTDDVATPDPGCESWYDRAQHGRIWRSVTDAQFAGGARGDGIHDDTAAIQAAIDYRRDDDDLKLTPGLGKAPAVVYVPSGRYLVSDTLVLWFYTHLMGSHHCPPTFVLKPNSSGFGDSEQGLKPVVVAMSGYNTSTYQHDWWDEPGHIGLTGRGDNENRNYYNQIHHLCIEIGSGNFAATGILWGVAQQTSIRSVEIHAGSAAIGLDIGGTDGYSAYIKKESHPGRHTHGGGGAIEDIAVYGGKIGMRVTCSQWTMRALHLSGASVAGISLHDSTTTIQFVGLQVASTPVALQMQGYTQSTVVLDSQFSNLSSGVAIDTASLNKGDPRELYVENVVVDESVHFIVDRVLPAPLDKHKAFFQGRASPLPGQTHGFVPRSRLMRAMRQRPTFDPDIGMADPANVLDFGAIGDGVHDDTSAFAEAISTSATVFVPWGYYRVTDTIAFRADTRIIGEGLAHVRLAENSSGFDDPDHPKALILTPDDPNATVLMADLRIHCGSGNPGAISVRWRAGPASGVWDTNLPSYASEIHAMLQVDGHGGGVFSNIWGWGAGYDVYNTTIHYAHPSKHGLLATSAGPAWFYGVAFEHQHVSSFMMQGASNFVLFTPQTEETPVALGIVDSEMIEVFGSLNTYREYPIPPLASRPSLIQLNRTGAGVRIVCPNTYGSKWLVDSDDPELRVPTDCFNGCASNWSSMAVAWVS